MSPSKTQAAASSILKSSPVTFLLQASSTSSSIPFIDWTYWTWQFGKSPVYRCFSHWKFHLWWIFPACHGHVCLNHRFGAAECRPLLTSSLYQECNISGDSLSIIEWFVQLALLLNDVPQHVSWAKNLGKLVSACEVKMIFERLLEWFNVLTFLHMLCSMEWVYVGSIGLLEKVPGSLPSFPKLQHGARNGARVGRAASRAARCARGAT